jgi:hypothetical protein
LRIVGTRHVVRAVVADPADRATFDDWYRREHLPNAAEAFAAQTAWRGGLGNAVQVTVNGVA